VSDSALECHAACMVPVAREYISKVSSDSDENYSFDVARQATNAHVRNSRHDNVLKVACELRLEIRLQIATKVTLEMHSAVCQRERELEIARVENSK
jgi:predicted sugar kinase